jgi:glycine cleavage system H lipoate-binding protein
LNGVELSETEWRKRVQEVKAPCDGKMVEIDGVKYKLVEA